MSWSVFLGGNHFRFPVEFTVLRISKYKPHLFKKNRSSNGIFLFFFAMLEFLKERKSWFLLLMENLPRERREKAAPPNRGERREQFWVVLVGLLFFLVVLPFPPPFVGVAVFSPSLRWWCCSLVVSPKSSNKIQLVSLNDSKSNWSKQRKVMWAKAKWSFSLLWHPPFGWCCFLSSCFGWSFSFLNSKHETELN